MSTASKRVPRIDAAAKRTRQKTADEVIVAAAPTKTTKRAKSTEKTRKASVSRANKSAVASRSPSRSPSRRGRKPSSNKSTLGAKVHTKKELETARSKRGASRSRRSPSATRTKSKSAERKSADRSRNKDLDEDLQQRYGSDNVKRNTYFEDDDLASSRYSLRKRATPTPSSSPSKASASSINIARRGAAKAKCWFTCGYLKYQNYDVYKIVAATVVLLIALAVINYFHLVDLATIRGSVTNCASAVYNTLIVKPFSLAYGASKAGCEAVRSFWSNAWARVAS